ncbi:MAG: hypothetical protein NZ896_05640 [Nitrososphaerales archaeon]|nr:hypothetical protein [Nitrososphaerales archaeon]
MVFEIVCSSCGATLYVGTELKSAKNILRASNGRCKNCGVKLSTQDFTLEIIPIDRS